MFKPVFILSLVVAARVGAQSVIQGPKCTGVIHGVVYELTGKLATGVRVVATPLGVQMGAFVPTAITDLNGEYRFEHVCPGRYTVMPDDPEVGYPSTFAEQNEFLYGSRTKAVRINLFHRTAELPIYLPPKPARVLLRVHNSETNSEILKFKVLLKVPSQRRSSEETMDFDNNNSEIAVPSGKVVILQVMIDGYREFRRSFSVDSGTQTVFDLRIEPVK